MPPKKRPTKNGNSGANKRKKAKSESSDSDFDGDNGDMAAAIAMSQNGDDSNDVGTIDESMYPKLLAPPGRLVICGGTNWDLIGRKDLPKTVKNAPSAANSRNLWGPHRTKYRVKLAISSSTACHMMLITEDNRVLTWGRNDRGQLGHGDTERRDEPTEVESLKNYEIIGGAVGRSHTLFLTSKGAVLACGDNKSGQLGIGQQTQTILTPTKLAFKGKPIVKLACGAEFSMIVDCVGSIYSFGFPQYGQLGHNTEGKYFASGNKLAYKCEHSPRKIMFFIEKTRDNHVVPVEGVHIVDVACGVSHTVAIDDKNRAFSWGFGGYGRLGHSEAKDEMIPRLIKMFDNRGAKQIWCGSTFALALDVHGLLYFWGQAKMSGEATMYPKNVQDLNGWNVRAVGCANKSIVVVADESVISWGPSPTYGELGYGENKGKSSTTPLEVKLLDGLHAHSISCGYGTSLFIVRDESDEEKKLIEKLPAWP